MKLVKNTFFSGVLDQIVFYPTPININYAWNFGSLAGVFLGVQIVSGLVLSMHYTPNVDLAFLSVEHIMRDVNSGWLLRYVHSNGASIFFICIYLHIARGLYYRSYFGNLYAWLLGVLIFLLAMATAFLGYVLPWGQMSFWGATVITNLFSAIPFVGKTISYFLWGGFAVGNPTLNRFFSLHFLLPFVIAAVAVLHLLVLHENGSSAPIGWRYADKVHFYPYFYIKDLFSFFVIIAGFFFLVHYEPDLLGHPDNYIEANPLATPAHIVPEWYFLPFYAILRSIPNKLAGVVFMFLAIVLFFFMNVLETAFLEEESATRGCLNPELDWIFIDNFIDPRFSGIHRLKCHLFFITFLLLGWVGAMPAEEPFVSLGLNLTIFYFLYLSFIVGGSNLYERFAFKNKFGFVDKVSANIKTRSKGRELGTNIKG